METQTAISFDNTEIAFAYKSDAELKKAHFLFLSMGKPWLVKLGVKLTPGLVRVKFPFFRALIRHTIFKQFVGGETLDQNLVVADKLEKYGVQVILDYGVEGKEGEENFEFASREFIKVVNYAASNPAFPFMSVKVTGFARFSLLEALDKQMKTGKGTLIKRYLDAVNSLPSEEKLEWHKVRLRLMRICEEAAKGNVGVLVDAEETWIQYPVDALVMMMMDIFNKDKIVIYNTIQHYRQDRLQFLKDSYDGARERNFILAVKLVRGAYMEKERERASLMGYPSPIQPDKESTDRDFNAGVEFCIDHLDKIALIVASHNENSSLFAAEMMQKKGLSLHHPHIHWSQLYGMSDNITFNLAINGCSVSKYLPFGPIKEVIPYLMRRAEENSSMKGQTGRELSLIKKEMKRRGI